MRRALLTAVYSTALAATPAFAASFGFEAQEAPPPADSSPAERGVSLSSVYDFYIGGVSIAGIAVDAAFDAGLYRSDMSVRSKGVIWLATGGTVAASAGGALTIGGAPAPEWFETQVEARFGDQAVAMNFEDGNLSRIFLDPPFQAEEYDVDPYAQQGALDPVSAFVAVFAAQTGDGPCNRTIPVFDGRRRFDVILLDYEKAEILETATDGVAPEWDAPLTRCLGVYERISGFDAKAAKDRYYQFDIWFEHFGGGIYRPVRIAGKTVLGYAMGNLREPTPES